MILDGLIELVGSEPVIAEAIADSDTGRLPALDLTMPEPLRPVFIAALARRTSRTILLVTSTFREAEALTSACTSLLD